MNEKKVMGKTSWECWDAVRDKKSGERRKMETKEGSGKGTEKGMEILEGESLNVIDGEGRGAVAVRGSGSGPKF